MKLSLTSQAYYNLDEGIIVYFLLVMYFSTNQHFDCFFPLVLGT